MPFRGHPLVLFYRKDVLDALKLPVPKTWQDVVKDAKVIQQKRPDLRGLSTMYGVSAGQNLFSWVSLLWGNGGNILDKNGHAVFNSAKGVEATQTYVDFLRKDKITSPASTHLRRTRVLHRVQAGPGRHVGRLVVVLGAVLRSQGGLRERPEQRGLRARAWLGGRHHPELRAGLAARHLQDVQKRRRRLGVHQVRHQHRRAGKGGLQPQHSPPRPTTPS